MLKNCSQNNNENYAKMGDPRFISKEVSRLIKNKI